MEKDKSQLQIATTISIIALIISIIALLNPHIEQGEITKKITMEIKGYAEFSTTNSRTFIKGVNPHSMKFKCTEGIILTNTFNDLCSVTGEVYCPTVPMWEAEGNGVCLIEYTQKKNYLRWF